MHMPRLYARDVQQHIDQPDDAVRVVADAGEIVKDLLGNSPATPSNKLSTYALTAVSGERNSCVATEIERDLS